MITPPAPFPATDGFGRAIDYLRISVTDRCDERCLYCMPEGYKGWTQRADHLDAAELIRVADAATRSGFRKFRLTGGEPLVRADIVAIAAGIWDLTGVQTLGISTNGQRLSQLALPLKQAGVRSLNISLDTLDPESYRRLTGGSLDKTLAGIDAAMAAGFECIKLNMVLLKGINENQIPRMADFAAARGMPLRFIELMPLAPGGPIHQGHFLSIADAAALLETDDRLEDAPERPPGHGPARYQRLARRRSIVGFIGSVTCNAFCATCNKLRLTADGKLRPCLGRHGEIDIRPALRQASGPAAINAALADAIANKPENHLFAEDFSPQRPMTAIGG